MKKDKQVTPMLEGEQKMGRNSYLSGKERLYLQGFVTNPSTNYEASLDMMIPAFSAAKIDAIV